MLCANQTAVLFVANGSTTCNSTSRVYKSISPLNFNSVQARGTKALLLNEVGEYFLFKNCSVETKYPIALPNNTSNKIVLKMGAENTIEGWDGSRGIYSFDEGATWFVSNEVPNIALGSRYVFHHTADGYDVVVSTMGPGANPDTATTVYIKKSDANNWSVQNLPLAIHIERIAGDSLSQLCLSFVGYASIYKNSPTQPIIWKYDPTVSVPPSPLTEMSHNSWVYTLSSAYALLVPNQHWVLYSCLGTVVAQYPHVLEQNSKLAQGIYFLVQAGKVLTVFATD